MSGSVPRYTSKLKGFRTADEISALRPIKKRRSAAHSVKPVRREVTTGIVCYCGKRFGEAEALEFMLHLRSEVGEDLAVLERRREGNRQAMRDRWARIKSDPELLKAEHEYQNNWGRQVVACPLCGAAITRSALSRHRKRMHRA